MKKNYEVRIKITKENGEKKNMYDTVHNYYNDFRRLVYRYESYITKEVAKVEFFKKGELVETIEM